MKLRNIGTWPPAFGGAYQRYSVFPQGEEGVLAGVTKIGAAPLGYPQTLPAHLNLRITYRGHQYDGNYLLGEHVGHIDAVREKLNGCIGQPVHELGDLEIEIPT